MIKYLSLAAILLFAASCANETKDNRETNGTDETDKITFVGGMVEQAKEDGSTRTSLDGTFPGTPGVNNVTFYWEPGDEIWLDNNKHATADITAKNTDAKFDFTGKSGIGNNRTVYYPGKNATTYNQVTIPTTQTQVAVNSTAHLGESGDCGVAKTTKIAYGKYKFTLKHKVAYLCLLPRSANNFANTVKVISIKVTSDNNIAGTYTLPDNEDGALTGTGSSKTITLKLWTNPDGNWIPHGKPSLFYCGLSNTSTDQSKNAVYMVIAPGMHKLTMEYMIRDLQTYRSITVTKTIPPQNYTENIVYPITANLTLALPQYKNEYYMWDAAEGHHYWYGHESDQPMVDGVPSNHYPQNNTDNRWYNEATQFPTAASRSCKNCPNINELLWYAQKGDPHWDDDKLWITMGHLYASGMWFKKKEHIPGFTASHAPNFIDYTHSASDGSYFNYQTPKITTSPLPNPNEYFFLPSLGYYKNGRLENIGSEGYYWTSTPYPLRASYTYVLHIYWGHTYVHSRENAVSGDRRWQLDGAGIQQP